MKEDLQRSIKGCENQFRADKASSEERYKQVHRDIGDLWTETEQLRGLVFSITMRVEAIEARMGYSDSYRL